MIRIGNDIVDLRDPRCPGKADDDRFVRRIYTDEEAASIRSASRPDARLWLLWAAKEAAYKVASKLAGSPPVFEHRAFGVRAEEPGDPSAEVRGRVRYQGSEIPFRAEPAPDRVHVVAWHDPAGDAPASLHRTIRPFRRRDERESGDWRASLRDRFTEREWASIHGPESALVRLAARRGLGRLLGVEESALEIVCPDGPPGRTPPELRVRGRPSEWDVSLSHHGRFLAWAAAGPREEGVGDQGR